MRREDVLPIAEELVELLRPACSRIEIAGSIRRERPDSRDIEIVCIPAPTPVVFGARPPLDTLIDNLIQGNRLAWDTKVKRNGPKYKRFRTLSYYRMPVVVELFLADADNFGNTLAIRTGSAEFSKWFVTGQDHGGGMPGGKCQKGGYLWRYDEVCCGGSPDVLIPCAEETDFFDALGLPTLPPPERDEAGIAKLKEEWRR